MTTVWPRLHRAALALVVTLGVLVLAAGPSAAQDPPPDIGDGFDTDASNDGDSAHGDVEVTIPGQGGGPGEQAGGGGGGPNCTRSDGTPDYLRYEGLQVTTMEEQRTEIRPEEQRPGVYLHIYCGNEWVDFRFFADAPAVPVIDPRTLADSVTITPADPVIRTNPEAGSHLVNLQAWFWTESWAGEQETATAGPVTVTVTAEPRELIIDPGDGTGAFTCTGQQPAYDPNRSVEAQSSNCTHTYRRAGHFTATATIVYAVSFTSNVGVGGDLGTIEPDATLALAVREGQAIVTG